MALKFEAGESVPEGTRRMAGELVDEAIDRMTRLNRFDKDIHETRKSFKKMRGLLRLTRTALGEFCYQRENAFFRDTGKRLSPLREGFVRTKTLDQMASRYRKALVDVDLEGLRRHLLNAHRRARAAFRGDAAQRADLVGHLHAAREAVQAWPLEGGEATVVQGMTRIYRQGRREMRASLRDPSTERLHDWRKRVKYLWYHHRIVSPCWPTVMIANAEALSALGELLGDDHDLADFEHELAGGEVRIEARRLEELQARIEQDRARLQQQAFELGERVYAESPAAFEARLTVVWQAWRDRS